MDYDDENICSICYENFNSHHAGWRIKSFNDGYLLTVGDFKLPEDFKLTGDHKQQSERVGRMVPPLMMKALAESIYNKVLKPYKELSND